jgi:hypothetical protein
MVLIGCRKGAFEIIRNWEWKIRKGYEGKLKIREGLLGNMARASTGELVGIDEESSVGITGVN